MASAEAAPWRSFEALGFEPPALQESFGSAALPFDAEATAEAPADSQ